LHILTRITRAIKQGYEAYYGSTVMRLTINLPGERVSYLCMSIIQYTLSRETTRESDSGNLKC